MAETITHNFVSAKTQSPDTTLVSKDEWNDGHVFTGGINGQVIVYDNTQPNNMRWVDGIRTYQSDTEVASSTASPITSASVSLTCNSSLKIIFNIGILIYTSVGAAAATVDIMIDGATIGADSLLSGATYSRSIALTATAGSHTYGVKVTTAGGVNITALRIRNSLISSGV